MEANVELREEVHLAEQQREVVGAGPGENEWYGCEVRDAGLNQQCAGFLPGEVSGQVTRVVCASQTAPRRTPIEKGCTFTVAPESSIPSA